MKTSLISFLFLMGVQALATPPHRPDPYPPIVNGIMISISQAPYQVLLNSGANGGGAIIADRWILTAAHLSNVSGGKAGVSTRSQTGQALQIANFYFPNNFDEQLTGQTIKYNSTSNPAHDIALIKLAQPLSISGNTTGYAQLASSQNQSLWNPGLRSVELSRQKAGGQVASSLTMDVGDLPRGVYYLHLTFGAKQERVRVILN